MRNLVERTGSTHHAQAVCANGRGAHVPSPSSVLFIDAANLVNLRASETPPSGLPVSGAICRRGPASSDHCRGRGGGPAAWRSAGPLASPSASPHFRVAERNRAPAEPEQSPWRTKTWFGGEALGDAAPFAASGVKGGVAGEGGATPSKSRGLDPAPRGAGRPAGGRSPLVDDEEQNRTRRGPRSSRGSVGVAAGAMAVARKEPRGVHGDDHEASWSRSEF